MGYVFAFLFGGVCMCGVIMYAAVQTTNLQQRRAATLRQVLRRLNERLDAHAPPVTGSMRVDEFIGELHYIKTGETV
jgi:hypothetical protein